MQEQEKANKYQLAAIFSVILINKVRMKWGEECTISQKEMQDISLQTFKSEHQALFHLFDPVFAESGRASLKKLKRRALYFRIRYDLLCGQVLGHDISEQNHKN